MAPDIKRRPQGLKAELLGADPMSGFETPTYGSRLSFEPLGHRIQPLQKPRVHRTPIHQPALPRIRRNITKLSPKILSVANPMLMKSNLPDFAVKLRPHLMRKSAFDALRASLNGLVFRRTQKQMQMFRHRNEPVQGVSPLIPIMKQGLDQQLGICRSNKERTPLVGRSRERVGFHVGCEEHTSGDKSLSVTAISFAGDESPAYHPGNIAQKV